MNPHDDPGCVITVTLNPAIDETIVLEELVPGSVNRALSHHRQAGGKGVNISSMLAQSGIRNTATGFLGADNAGLFAELFRDLGINDRFIRIPGVTRGNFKLVASGGGVTEINLPGAPPAAEAFTMLEEVLRELSAPGRRFVISGSMPPGLNADALVRLLEVIRSRGGWIAVDTSGPALGAAIGFGVDLIKPNRHELADVLGIDGSNTSGLIDAARAIHEDGIPHVVLSLGGSGALFHARDGCCAADAPPVEPATTVGAGDSLLAGYLAGLCRGLGVVERAALATAYAWSSIESLQRRLPTAAVIDARRRHSLTELLRIS